MNFLKLGLVGLSSAEEALVATLFRLHGVDPSFIWTLASEAPFDALLVDTRSYEAALAGWKGRKTHLMRLGPLVGDVDGVLMRPIRSDLLMRWLNSIEVEILHGGQDPFASTVSASAFHGVHWKVSSFFGMGKEDALHAFKVGGCAFKLRRWPTPDLLKGDVHRIRMATMLSRRHLKLAELSSLCRMPEVKCEEFVEELYKSQLLDEATSKAVDVEAAPLVKQPLVDVPTLRDEPKARGLGRSLIASIRKRFGIL
ncbi:hypothetical protein [Hydrogenophaga sp. 2FB]|uniref:hypothetical protein n=1 Tax=Hydrogenophaga sp. 2FB TaxID=2502187 RepID=UPI0010F74F50|nr:hypothetical protein [Hydrogenophaga sp. 2FB]